MDELEEAKAKAAAAYNAAADYFDHAVSSFWHRFGRRTVDRINLLPGESVLALLQGRKSETGSISRVSAPDVEKLIIDAMRAQRPIDPHASDRDVVEQHLARAIIGKSAIEIELAATEDAPISQDKSDTIRIPFAPTTPPRKGVAHEPTAPKALDDTNRTALLTAIARAKSWIETIRKDPSQSFKTIAEREQLAERHVRFLAPLAFLSPRIVEFDRKQRDAGRPHSLESRS